MVKEMYNSTPASACRVPDLLKLKPAEQGAAVMVRDSKAAKDGWFWGWYGWPPPPPKSGWHVDFPPVASNPLPFMGFGQYCLNCHASARDNQTFASPENIKGQPGAYLSFLSQDFYQNQSFGIQAPVKGPETAVPSEHLKILALSQLPASMPLISLLPSSSSYLAALNLHQFQPITQDQLNALNMPSQTYDNVWIAGRGPKEAHAFVTSDQCVGCHSAGGTGLQFPMTAPIVINKNSLMYNFSPYGTWRTSPMGLAGRDPIFFAQLNSETRSFHPDLSATVQNTCLGCHGIEGQRQFAIDTVTPGSCPDFLRTMVNSIPYPADTPESRFGGLAGRHLLRGLPPHGPRRGRHRTLRQGTAKPLRRAAPGIPQSGQQAFRAHLQSKIADIQEHGNFPEVENGLPATDIDLPVPRGMLFVDRQMNRVARAADFRAFDGLAVLGDDPESVFHRALFGVLERAVELVRVAENGFRRVGAGHVTALARLGDRAGTEGQLALGGVAGPVGAEGPLGVGGLFVAVVDRFGLFGRICPRSGSCRALWDTKPAGRASRCFIGAAAAVRGARNGPW